MSATVGALSTTYVVPPGHVVLVLTEAGALAYRRPDDVIVEVEGRHNWCGRWLLVAGQTTYTWDSATVHDGSTGTGPADTRAWLALVQWGPLLLIPDVDYSITADAVVLTPPGPTSAEVADGVPLVCRLFRRPE